MNCEHSKERKPGNSGRLRSALGVCSVSYLSVGKAETPRASWKTRRPCRGVGDSGKEFTVGRRCERREGIQPLQRESQDRAFYGRAPGVGIQKEVGPVGRNCSRRRAFGQEFRVYQATLLIGSSKTVGSRICGQVGRGSQAFTSRGNNGSPQ